MHPEARATEAGKVVADSQLMSSTAGRVIGNLRPVTDRPVVAAKSGRQQSLCWHELPDRWSGDNYPDKLLFTVQLKYSLRKYKVLRPPVEHVIHSKHSALTNAGFQYG